MNPPAPLPVKISGRSLETVALPGRDDRRPLVLLHEGLGSVRLWRGFPEAVNRATGRRVIVFSRFGHGHSDPPPRPRTPAFFHEEALEVLPQLLEQVGAERPLLVGHSDGASIAVIHAAQHPVSGLVLMAPHVFVEPICVEEIRRVRVAFEHDGLRERMGRYHDDPDVTFSGWCDVWLDPEFLSWSLEDEAAAITAPTLLIQGGDDAYGTLKQLSRIERRARGPVQRLVVPGGHSPHLDAPEQVLDAIQEFTRPLP